MAEKTGIAWTRSTFNPWIGCTKVGPGCDHCYAEQDDKRYRWGGAVHWGPGVPRHRTKTWDEPLKWNRAQGMALDSWHAGDVPEPEPWRVFCASLADVFDNEVDPMWRHDLWKLILNTRNLEWLIVTKRISNVEKMWPIMAHEPPPNVRLLITVCNQEEADRDIPKLLALPCKNGVSYEPALGPVDWAPWLGDCEVAGGIEDGFRSWAGRGLEWIIVGGESTQGSGKARPFDLAWARSTIAQCKAADVPCFVKQIGSATLGWCLGNRPTGECPELENLECQAYEASEQNQNCPPGYCACRENRAGADPSEWPEDLRVQEFPE